MIESVADYVNESPDMCIIFDPNWCQPIRIAVDILLWTGDMPCLYLCFIFSGANANYIDAKNFSNIGISLKFALKYV